MPRGFRGYGYLRQLVAAGHQAPPWETWTSEMGYNPIPVLRLTQKIDEYETEHNKPCPPGIVIALAKQQGLDPSETTAKELLEERKQWRGHKAIPDPGVGCKLEVSILPKGAGAADPWGGNFIAGRQIKVTALPNEGYQFDRWTGDYSGKDNPCTITMDSNKKLTAHLKKQAVEPIPGGTP